MKIFSSCFWSVLLALLGTWADLCAQNSYANLDHNYNLLVDRYEIQSGKHSSYFHGGVKPLSRPDVAAFADTLFSNEALKKSKLDDFNLQYLCVDNWEWSKHAKSKSLDQPVPKIYTKKSDFFYVKEPNFSLHLNPIIHFGMGSDPLIAPNRVFINARGAEIYGTVGQRIGYYASVAETQARFPRYIRNEIDSFNVVPNEAFWKDFRNGGVDFITSRGYITWRMAKVVHAQFGHDRHFLGHGFRSLALSDYAAPYLFLKLRTQVWKIQYTNLFAQLTADVLRANNVYPKKYMVNHHLSMNILPNLNVGLFESVVYGRKDNRVNDGIELGYLNPLIFYRSIEQNLGSADNAFLGLDAKYSFMKSFQIYTQVVLDEFVLKEVMNRKGWWGNKQGIQLGAKYINVGGINNLDLQIEYNTVRPYTYTHFNFEELSNYAHYRQSMAHPMGANFKETLLIVRYQPYKKFTLTSKIISAVFGEDSDGKNWGGNILKDNTTYVQEYGNKTGQGVKANLLIADFLGSYQFRHNLFFDGRITYRNKQSQDDKLDLSSVIVHLAVRLNIATRPYDF
ncbi:MAG: hypothetical protein EAZ57_06725 [Cytophagales bacterium]|nr:MAG: hypothetical protein EAZ67_07810 [Cytophagales bacterium]TAF60553.1 MAG: hypothetical protein EAZ57_06725 [Cytophagales bacterium]